MVTVHQAMSHKLLHVIQNVLSETRILSVERKFHDPEVLVRGEHLVVSVCLDLLHGLTAQVLQFFAFARHCLAYLLEAADEHLLVELIVGSRSSNGTIPNCFTGTRASRHGHAAHSGLLVRLL